MSEIVIRKATMQDMEYLLQFEQGVIEAERPFDNTIKRGKVKYYKLSEMIESSDIEIAVAEVNNQLIASGYARIENTKQFFQHRQFAYLGFIYVVPEYRRKGVAQKIIEYLKNWAMNKRITELRLDVYVNNISAIKAYEKIGFVRNVLEMRMDVK